MKFVLGILALSISFLSSYRADAANIAFGFVTAIKVYDSSGNKLTKIHFASDATEQNVPGCNLVANITHSLHSETAIEQFVSIAMSAYIAGKKIRAYSFADTCEADFIAIQETFF